MNDSVEQTESALPISKGWLLFLAILIWFSPVLRAGESHWASHSGLFDLQKTMGLYHAWQEGYWDGRWIPGFNYGYGSPILTFHSPLLYWFSAGIMSVVKFLTWDSHAASIGIRISLFLFLWFGAWGMYKSGDFFWRRIAGEEQARYAQPGVICVIAWLISPWPVINVYVRSSLAEFCSYQLMPWVFYFVMRALLNTPAEWTKQIRMVILGGACMCLSILCHNHGGMVVSGFGCALIVVFLPLSWAFKTKPIYLFRGVIQILMMVLLGLGLSFFFWFPALMEQGNANIQSATKDFVDFRNHFVYFENLKKVNLMDFGNNYGGYLRDGMPLHLGYVSVVSLLSSLGAVVWLIVKGRELDLQNYKTAIWGILLILLATFAGLFLAMPASTWVWSNFDLLRQGQFPFRLLFLPTFGFALLLPALIMIQPLRGIQGKAKRMMSILFLLFLLSYYSYFRVIEWVHLGEANQYDNWKMLDLHATNAREFDPIWSVGRKTKPDILPNQLLVLESTKKVSVEVDLAHIPEPRFSVTNDTDHTIQLQFGRNYYPSFSVSMISGEPVEMIPHKETGLISFLVPPGTSAWRINYGTTLRDLSVIPSLILAMVSVALLLWGYRKEVKKSPVRSQD